MVVFWLVFEMIFVVNLVGYGLCSWWPVDLGCEIIFYWAYEFVVFWLVFEMIFVVNLVGYGL